MLAVHLGRVVADHRDPRPGLDERARDERVLAGTRARRRRARRRAAPAPRAAASGRPAGGRRTAGDPAGSPARALNDSCQTGHASRSASATSAAHVSRIVGARTDDERRTAAAPASSSASSATTRRGRPPRARTTRPAARALAARPASAAQSSIGTITSAGPLPVSASWQARAIAPGTSWARTGWSTHTGYSPASPCSLPARNGSVARWRRSCWPTTTTSGARLTRAVASAPTAFPRPAVVCRIASAGSPRPIAQPVAMPTTEPSCSPSTKRRSSGRSASSLISVEPGLAKIVVRPYSRKTSKVASRTDLRQPRRSIHEMI